MAISSAVTGTAGATTGDVRTAKTFTSDQYSLIQVTSTQLTGGQWVGPAVRLQNSGQNGYVGHLLLEQWQPATDAVQEDRGELDAAGQQYT